MKRSSAYFFAAFFLTVCLHAQTFELGSGLFSYKVTGDVLVMSSYSGTYYSNQVNHNNRYPLGLAFNYYHPFLKGSPEVSLGLLTGIAGFFKLEEPSSVETNLYQYNQLKTTPGYTKGFQVPLLVNCRLGRDATKYSNADVGLAFGGGITMSGFNFGEYYYDKFIYFPLTVNADLVLGRTRFRLMYFLTPYKTYYVYDTGAKITKYDFAQFSVTANITLGDN